MHQLHAIRLSLVLNQTLRLVVGVHTKHTGDSIPALYIELSIPSMKSLIKGRRARLWAKEPTISTWISVLCRWIPAFRRGTLAKSIKPWLMRRLVGSAVNSIQLSNRCSKTLREVFRKWLTTGKMTQPHTWREYRQLARLGRLDVQWRTCACCLANVPGTLSHLLCECTQLDSKRLGICGSMWKACTDEFVEEDSSTTVELQKKKALDEAIHRWWMTGEFSYRGYTSILVAQGLDNGSSQCWYWTGLPGFILIGRFLEAVMDIRMFIVENLVALALTLATKPPRANALEGMTFPFE
ncbi:hypothetical protein GAYE_SCF25G4519 [Galdieria yellowstonensis]|uniref:Reverse transcriptase zinc-binding domain-containing protein n=1 Tax=Galdieria yellowstonensis TaxID=3028027 RepID=A0AAV9IH54_9RHOD|nr:hypothetical protein GAYE_SCF25G4519 [Galdieria yellowstonensis]